MTHAITHDTTVGIGGFSGWVARMRKALADHRLYRKTVAELESLSDRELNDLGLSRTVLQDVARQSVYDT